MARHFMLQEQADGGTLLVHWPLNAPFFKVHHDRGMFPSQSVDDWTVFQQTQTIILGNQAPWPIGCNEAGANKFLGNLRNVQCNVMIKLKFLSDQFQFPVKLGRGLQFVYRRIEIDNRFELRMSCFGQLHTPPCRSYRYSQVFNREVDVSNRSVPRISASPVIEGVQIPD